LKGGSAGSEAPEGRRTDQGIGRPREIGCGVLVGALDGLFSGLTGVGGGAVLVPLLVTALKVPQHHAHGTSLAIIVLIAAAGVPVYATQGAVNWALAAQLAMGSMVGVVLGAKLMLRVPAVVLRRGFGVFLLLIAVKMLAG